MLRTLIVISLMATANPGNSQADLAENAFRNALHQTMLQMVEPSLRARPPAPNLTETEIQDLVQKYADGITNCTMMAIQLYPREIIDIGYSTVAGGGSYPDAKMAMENALRAEMIAGGEREAKVMSIVQAMGQQSMACVREVTGS